MDPASHVRHLIDSLRRALPTATGNAQPEAARDGGGGGEMDARWR